jgi:S-formylglutathione hydrolase FrmB
MAFCDITFFSEVLAKQTSLYVILPDKGKPPFAVYYLLHGMSDDHTIWHRRTRIEWYVRDMPLIVVMPDGYRGFYTDNNEGPAYATHFAEELPAFIERNFPAKTTRAGRCVGGLSMGGYGALRLALGYPDRYVSANSHSGALLRGSELRGGPREAEFERVFGKNPTGSDHDLEALVKGRLASKKPLPKLRIDCGVDDGLITHNRRFHAFLDKQKVAHEYAEFPGAHTWDFWDEHVRESLAFHASALKI